MRAVTEFERADGATTYRVRFRHLGHNTTETFSTREQAERFARLLDDLGSQRALDQIYTEDQRPDVETLDEFAAKYIASLTRITDGTRVSYERIYKRVWAKPIGWRSLHQIDKYQIADVINAMVADGKSDKTIANAHGLLAGIMNAAVVDAIIGVSPCRATKLPRNTEHQTDLLEPMTREEYETLRQFVPEHFRPLVDTLAGTGMRWGEAEALQVRSINFRTKTISITRSAKWNASKSTRSFGPPKTPKSRRRIPLPDWLSPSLAEIVRDKGREDLVFTMPKGGQLRHATFYHRYWIPACEESGVEPRPTIHGLRHGFASWMLEDGTDIHVVQALLGHEKVTTTVDTYGHLMPSSKAAAAVAANNLFSPARRASLAATSVAALEPAEDD